MYRDYPLRRRIVLTPNTNLVSRSFLVEVGVVYQPDVSYNIDGLILSGLKYIIAFKMVPKTKV